MKELYIQTRPSEKWGLVMEENHIDRVSVSREHTGGQIGNIYKGRVVNIEPSLQAAFVHFGSNKLGFLKCSEIPRSRIEPEKRIEQLIHEGEAIWVQVIKEAFEDKGAQLTANITLPGDALVYLPFGHYHAVSKKLDHEKREELMALADEWCESGEGILFRTAAKEKSSEALQQSFSHLKKEWDGIERANGQRKPPLLAWEDPEIPDRFIRQYGIKEIESVIVDEWKTKTRIEKRFPSLAGKCVMKSSDSWPVSIDHLIEQVTSRTVTLPGGAELVIDQTEAMVVMDINTSKNVKKSSKGQSILHTNIAAAKEVARQLRVRNLSGMVLIDFISMRNPNDQQKVLHALKKELKQDPIRSEVFGFTKLGIVEMTRKRTSKALPYLFTAGQKSVELSFETKAYQLERELLSYQASDQEVLVMEVHPDLLSVFQKKIDLEKLKSILYKDVYVLNNSTSDKFYRIRYVGDEKNLQERPFYIDGSLDRLF